MNKLDKVIEEVKENYEKERKISGFDYGRLRHDDGIIDGLVYAKRLIGTCGNCKYAEQYAGEYITCAQIHTTFPKTHFCGYHESVT